MGSEQESYIELGDNDPFARVVEVLSSSIHDRESNKIGFVFALLTCIIPKMLPHHIR